MFRHIGQTLQMIRPRSLARMQKSLDDLLDGVHVLRRTIKQQGEESESIDQRQQRDAAAIAARFAEVNARLRELTEQVCALTLRESQLRAIAAADADTQDAIQRLPTICDEARVTAHVRGAIARTAFTVEPLPYMVVDGVFPDDFYEALVRGLPPYELFADKPTNKQQLKVPLAYGPVFSRTVWKFLVDVVLEEAFCPAILERFKEPLGTWIGQEWPALAADPFGPPMELHTTDGRILLRGRGYRIRPHRDPKWGFITVLLYLPRSGDSERWGTQIYSVEGDTAASSIAPYWIDPARCHLAADVPFRRNSALVFLNSHGAHGAFIPDDAQPADLQRYMYQFRIGPTKTAIQNLVAMLPRERRSVWEGKLVDYLA